MRELTIKTKVLKLTDYKSVDFSDRFPKFSCDKEKLNGDVRRIQYANGEKKQADTVAIGDMVLLSCTSSHKHYQKNDIYVIVGRKLYSQELEEKLIGLSKGRAEITVENVPVSVEIKGITRTVIPELTDENVKKWGIEKVSTVEELKRYYFDRQVDNFRDDNEEADMVNSMFAMEVLGNCTFEHDENERQALIRSTQAQIDKAKQMQDEDTDVDFVELAQMMILQTLNAAALGYTLCKENGRLLTEADYKNELENRAEILRVTPEKLSETYSKTDYALEFYSEYYFNTLYDYIGSAMKEYYYKQNNKPDIYDVAIIGAGPAGLSAALTLRLHNKTILWFGTDALSEKVEKSEKIANYAGFPTLSGKELNDRFRAQIQSSGLELTDKMVTQISSNKRGFMVLADNDIYKAKTVLLTIGSVPAKGIKNETEFLGHGVSYCATCDGFLYKGKKTAVYCGAKRYEHEVEYLAGIAEKVYLFAGYDDVEIDLPNVELPKKPMKAVLGDTRVSGVELTDGTVLDLDGAFFLRSAVAPATILSGLEMNGAHIVVDRDCRTNIPGCFAAGDCTGRPYQIAKAVGEGNVAAHSITEYLAEGKS